MHSIGTEFSLRHAHTVAIKNRVNLLRLAGKPTRLRLHRSRSSRRSPNAFISSSDGTYGGVRLGEGFVDPSTLPCWY